jgi:hypothetical protein
VAILSVVESRRRLKLPVRDHLAAILPGLADCPVQRLPELTPAAMVTQKHAKLGDFATVVNLRNGKVAAGIVADESASELPTGEGSIALAVALGIESNPRIGGIEQGVGYVIYPGSGNGTPRTLDEIVSTSGAYFRRWGALRNLRGCLR